MRPSCLLAALFLTVAASSVPNTSYAQDATQRPAEIRLGSCASIGDAVVPLETVVAPQSDESVASGVTPVEQSVTVVPLLLPDLMANGYVVVVGKSVDEPGTLAACGAVGGSPSEDGTLAVGINPMEGSRLSGVAYFSPKRDDSGTAVTLLLVDNRAAEAASGPAGPVGMAGEDGTITIGGVTEGTGSLSSVDDGSGPAPSDAAASTEAPAPAETVENAESADGKGNKGNKGGKGRGGKGNAGNDGASSASG